MFFEFLAWADLHTDLHTDLQTGQQCTHRAQRPLQSCLCKAEGGGRVLNSGLSWHSLGVTLCTHTLTQKQKEVNWWRARAPRDWLKNWLWERAQIGKIREIRRRFEEEKNVPTCLVVNASNRQNKAIMRLRLMVWVSCTRFNVTHGDSPLLLGGIQAW